jgi:PAS domain S-box-containing protein
VLATLTATVARLLLEPFIGLDFPFITYFAAVFVSAWWFGFYPTLLTVLLSAFLTDLLFLPATGTNGPAVSLLSFIGLTLFVGIGVGTAYMGKSRLDAQRQAATEAAAAQRLQAVVKEEADRAEEETTRADEESARAQSGNRFFALSRDMLCTIDFDGYFKDLNPAWEKTLGYTQAELLARPFIAFVHPDDRQATLDGAEEISGGSTLLAFENRYRCKDGSYRSLLWSATPVIEDRLMYGVARDVTERKQAEEALLKATALQRGILNSVMFSKIATDAKGMIQIFNVGAERMLGYAAAEVVNQITPFDIFDPEEMIVLAKTLSVELHTPITPGFTALVFKASRGIEDICELTYVRKDGTRFPAVVSITALRDAQEAIIGYLLIGTDNTVRKQVEVERMRLGQRLRDQHFYTRSLLESNIDALMATDPRGIITDVNKQMETLTGCTRDELIGAPFKNYVTDAGLAEAGMGISTPPSEERSWQHRSMPSMSGSRRSRRASEGACRVARSKAVRPSPASSTPYPAASRANRNILRVMGLSSTTRMVPEGIRPFPVAAGLPWPEEASTAHAASSRAPRERIAPRKTRDTDGAMSNLWQGVRCDT